MPIKNLRPWQSDATHQALTWLLETGTDKHFLIDAAPGAGKTICASFIAQRLIEADAIDRVIVIAPRAQVVSQWAKEFKFVTGRSMTKVTAAYDDIADFGVDLCATWTAIEGLQDGFQQVCRQFRTLVICDEHHHAAVEAAWGVNATSAFAEAKYVLVLTGTPSRPDGQETVWLLYDDNGRIAHPKAGTYTLSYGKAVDLGFCRPITFHRHEGLFSVKLREGDPILVSGEFGPELRPEHKRIKGLQKALDFYKLACTPAYLDDGITPDLDSYQSSMLKCGIAKLNDLRRVIPNAGGLVIAPDIRVARYMAACLERLEGEKPVLVHSQMASAEARIDSFRDGEQRWLVSVAMVSEGVDIKRLRVLVYLPLAQTELAFRQAMGRVVRSLGDDDCSRAYVVMPQYCIFEEYARRVEHEMDSIARAEPKTPSLKSCLHCGALSPRGARTCRDCKAEFSTYPTSFKPCEDCGALNPETAGECQFCGRSLRTAFDLTLRRARRRGVIVRGMDLEEEEVRNAESRKEDFHATALTSGDNAIIRALRTLPEESWGWLLNYAKNVKDHSG